MESEDIDNWKLYHNTLENDNHILKVIGVDRESSKKGEVKRILFKKGSESRGAILTECRRNRWLPINDQKREQIKEIKNLNNTKGILKISGLYVEKNKFTFHHKHFENTLPKFIQKAKEENKPIKIKTCMKETGKTIKRLIDKELHPKRLTPENLVVVKKYDAKKFLLFNMFGSSINKDSEFYGRIFWIKKLLCNANGARQIIIKFGFSILYSICLEDENLLKKEFPEEKDILGLLEKHMAAFRIIFLYNLLRKMIFQRDFSMDDFFKHFFWYKATLINEFVDKAKVYIEGRPYLRLTFNAELSEIFKDWHLQIKDFDIREGFLFQFHPDYISPFHLLKVIRNFNAHIILPKYKRFRTKQLNEHKKDNPKSKKDEMFLCDRYFLKMFPHHYLFVYEFLLCNQIDGTLEKFYKPR